MTNNISNCPGCRAPLPADAPGGHCPACLMSLALAAGETGLSADAPMLQPGDRVGRYQLLEEIGEGGCGVVFLAEQTDPVRRRVALKVIKPGMDTRQVIARFEAERQVLALLDHPNIARVFDAGATASGRPFFVMELVRGVKITDDCDRQKLSPRRRLELFIQVCQAVRHAHQKGVIHRDLKPSNILVTAADGGAGGAPKIIDFGIAKSTAQPLTDRTLFTGFTQFLGTPAYMSPEQAGPGADIDTRSDVYSLGVLLYELLTGRTPFSPDDFHLLAPDEILRLIREHEPSRPSSRLANLPASELNLVAHARQTDPARLVSLVRGDLDWIVMKCLEKDRARRYESASALAADLDRHLNHEPVAARPPGNWYRLGKTVRRHQLAFGAAAALTATLMLGIAASSYQAVRATAEADRNEQVAGFLADIFKSAGPSVALGRDTTLLREILDRASERAARDLGNQPEAQAEIRNTLADTYRELGLYREMEAMARESLRLSRARSDGENPTAAKAMELLGDALTQLGRLTEAEAVSRETLALRKKLLGAEDPDVSTSINNLGMVLREEGRPREAEALFRESLAMDRKLLGDQHPKTATGLGNLGAALWSEGRFAESEAICRQALAARRKIAFSENPDIAVALNNLAVVIASEGRLAEAEKLNREAIALDEKYLAPDHPQLLAALDNLDSILSAEGKTLEAQPLRRTPAVAR